MRANQTAHRRRWHRKRYTHPDGGGHWWRRLHPSRTRLIDYCLANVGSWSGLNVGVRAAPFHGLSRFLEASAVYPSPRRGFQYVSSMTRGLSRRSLRSSLSVLDLGLRFASRVEITIKAFAAIGGAALSHEANLQDFNVLSSKAIGTSLKRSVTTHTAIDIAKARRSLGTFAMVSIFWPSSALSMPYWMPR
ncbi:hypothetical protein BV25DRAFT_794059 [Artomyces pyxidatus]|uniref:Uncharacterized protein n=1 Tax=Artomyces pyxidatus TaxID=48021 RepID=A0ACB8SY30_9AGAM|nr:hypothetical protein BV25DRAFT_794059 [Artomyces pyxidatus]